MSDVIAVTWFSHRRMTGLCEGLGIELHTLSSASRGLRRYFELAPRTVSLLRARRPKLLFVQNPSLALTVYVMALKRWFGYRLVVDAHNEAVEPFVNRAGWVRWVAAQLLKRADLTLVTNRWLAEIVERHRGRAFVLPDPLPQIPVAPPSTGEQEREPALPHVVVIATYALDEPFEAILGAAATLGSEARFSLTGNPQKLAQAIRERAPSNVRFTGFLEEPDYWALLRSADMIMDLTLMDSCLVCGAYEAVAAGKPAILSRNPACVELFQGAAVFTDNSPRDIVNAIRSLLRTRAELQRTVPEVARRLRIDWEARARGLQARLRALIATEWQGVM